MAESLCSLRRLYYRCLIRFGLLLSVVGLAPSVAAVALLPRSAVQSWIILVIGCSVFLVALSLYAILQWRVLFHHVRPLVEMGRLGTIVARVAHDLRSPLASLRAVSFSLVRADHTARPSPELVRLLQLAIGRIERISDEVLDGHEGAATAQQLVDVQPILSALIQEYQLHPSLRGVVFSTEGAEGKVLVAGQRHRLERMFANVLKNAIEAMNFSGHITVCVRSDEQQATIAIRDTGPGLGAEQIAAILARRPDAHRSRNGHGIGLAFVQEVLHDHNGSLQIESAPGQGATFHLHLPLLSTAFGDMVSNVIPLARAAVAAQ